jgi:hypothetical protein
VALDESLEQEADDSVSDRTAARRAVKEFAGKLLPSWEVIGVHTQLVGKQEYRAMVDVEKGKRRETLDLFVVRFFPEDAEPYWNVRPMTTNLDRALRETEEIQRIKDLNKLNSALDEARSSQ